MVVQTDNCTCGRLAATSFKRTHPALCRPKTAHSHPSIEMSHTPTTFDGTTGVSGDVFIRSLRQNSLREGREKDDEWIALSAASWLEGEALEWYEDQTEETQESWKLLRRAILVRWPASRAAGQPLYGLSLLASPPKPVQSNSFLNSASSADPTINAHIPTPAAAPPVSTLIDRALVPARFAPSSETGRIRVIRRTGDHLGYISSNLGRYGDYYMRTDLPSAVVVKFTPSLDPHELIVVVSCLSSPNTPRSLG